MIPVYATQDTSIENNEISFVQVASPNLEMRDSDYLFEGKDDKVEFFCGIVTGDRRNVAVRNESGARIKVEEGKQIGMISKLMEDDKQTLDDTWTMKSLKDKIDMTKTSMTEKEKEEVLKMLLTVSRALSVSDEDIGNAQVAPHKIHLSDRTPIWQRPRSFSQPINEEIEKQCNELLYDCVSIIAN